MCLLYMNSITSKRTCLCIFENVDDANEAKEWASEMGLSWWKDESWLMYNKNIAYLNTRNLHWEFFLWHLVLSRWLPWLWWRLWLWGLLDIGDVAGGEDWEVLKTQVRFTEDGHLLLVSHEGCRSHSRSQSHLITITSWNKRFYEIHHRVGILLVDNIVFNLSCLKSEQNLVKVSYSHVFMCLLKLKPVFILHFYSELYFLKSRFSMYF